MKKPLFVDRSLDAQFMAEALEQARLGAQLGEVPVGAVLVRDGEVLGRGFNQPIASRDPSAHAEMVALRAAALAVDNYRLPGSTLYVTLEPCSMCAGLIVHARVARLVYAASEPRAGVASSRGQFFQQDFLNHRVLVEGGLLAEESAELLRGFFRARRSSD
ncbi:tRNA adenosine(34) deaminase TadA [Pseudomonas fluvialis]|jgi:tRNA(adenine34) deaminase|uniref:tRNA-specific adenosine deaminase n=1 Tax=Pseudomonas fluvialis TaxID=1793966 RepID=A0A2I0CQ58_9PSED|nr:tRNA adenosine(34) deaminase TadA [Pseudomonas pharmacofabricae]MBP7823580.1 tRNA adenosine(34) deaminase TadA [Pseudomonas sp.]MBP8263989.1 tRNA adenosine(34) deaminase TadA [Pseudomonas sp.]PKF71280.1 tRNA-specific adenosine deaminase [Pseudomonas pharmacofabricae]